jgi:hypothetical protein
MSKSNGLARLEARVEALERELASLRQAPGGSGPPREKDWRRTIGMFTGDEGMQKVFEDAMKLREADRERARRRYGRRTTKPSQKRPRAKA